MPKLPPHRTTTRIHPPRVARSTSRSSATADKIRQLTGMISHPGVQKTSYQRVGAGRSQKGVLPQEMPQMLMCRSATRIHPPAAAKSTLRRSTSAVVRRRITEISRHPDEPKRTCQKVIAGKSHKRRERNFMRSQGLKKREASRVEPCTTQQVNVEGASQSAVAPQRPSMPRVRAKATTGQNACRRDAPAISIMSRTTPAGNLRS